MTEKAASMLFVGARVERTKHPFGYGTVSRKGFFSLSIKWSNGCTEKRRFAECDDLRFSDWQPEMY